MTIGAQGRRQRLVVDVRDYGAVPDTGTNQVGAINAAILAAEAAGRGRVLLQAGTYLGAGIIVRPGVALIGEGMDATTIKRDALSGVVVEIVMVGEDQSGAVSDLTVDGDTYGLVAAGPDGQRIPLFAGWDIISGGPGARLDRVRVKDSPGYAIGQASEDGVISFCRVEGAANGDISWDVASIGTGNPATVTTTVDHGLTTGTIVGIVGASTTPTLTGLPGYAVTVTGARTFTIPVNVTSGAGAGGKIGCGNGPTMAGIVSIEASNKRCLLVDNVVTGTYLGAVWIDGTGAIFARNHLYDNHHQATATGGGQLYLTLDGGVTEGDHIVAENIIERTPEFIAAHPTSNAQYGIEFNTKNVTVMGNRILNNGSHGIYLQVGTATGQRMIGNVIRGNGGAGLMVLPDVSDWSAIGNEITENGYGIRVLAGAGDNYTIVGNTMSDNTTADYVNDATGVNRRVVGNLPVTVTDDGATAWSPYLWTPTNGSSMTGQTSEGTYTKVGRLVTATFHVKLATLGTASGNVYLQGLPFAVENDLGSMGSASVGNYFGFQAGITTAPIVVPQPNQTYAFLNKVGAGAVVQITVADLSAVAEIFGSISYFAA